MHFGYNKIAVAGRWPALVLTAATAARAEGWGTIKGQVVWDGDDVPKRDQVNVNKDKADLPEERADLQDRIRGQPQEQGRPLVRRLPDERGWLRQGHPRSSQLKEIKNKTVELDQPCCQFEPHMLAMREGQTLIVKNSAGIAHNVNIQGGAKGPNLNQIVPPGGKSQGRGHQLRRPNSDDSQVRYPPWMSGRVAVLKNPYFAVTDADGNFEIKDAPAGNFRLVVWHEGSGLGCRRRKPSKTAARKSPSRTARRPIWARSP